MSHVHDPMISKNQNQLKENEMPMKVRHDHASFQGLLPDTGHSKQVKSHLAKHADSSEDDEDLAEIHASKHAV